MEHNAPLRELACCIARHNETTRAARELWAQAEQEGRRIGQLAGLLLAGGLPAVDVGRLLVAVDDTSAAPDGLASTLVTPQQALAAATSASHSTSRGKPESRADHAPPQAERAAPPPEKPCDQTRALDIVRGVRWASGITVGTLTRVLADEGRTITEDQAQSWLTGWSADGEVALIGADRYLHTARAAHNRAEGPAADTLPDEAEERGSRPTTHRDAGGVSRVPTQSP
ncbi:hypothetical protein ACFWVB_26200 [Streptomyces microflavus]|uniref:hypothetical protein n=1 Tax=Streptomyces microflavus TaxID=1919 RepID=UPI00365F528B